MKKREADLVVAELAPYMLKMVKVIVNQYKGSWDEEKGTPVDDFGYCNARFLMLNLVEESEVMEIATTAFVKAYSAWDGVRPIKPLWRITFVNLCNNLISKKAKERAREVPMTALALDHVSYEWQNEDERYYTIPVEQCDFWDFVGSLPPIHRYVVELVLNATEMLGVTDGSKPKEVLSALKERLLTEGTVNTYTYPKVMNEIREFVKGRIKDVTHHYSRG